MVLKNTSHKILWQFSIELDLVNKARRLTKARIIARFLSLLLEILGFCKGKKKKKVKKKKKIMQFDREIKENIGIER